MMKTRFVLMPFLALWLSTNFSLGAVVEGGVEFDKVSEAMTEAGYIETGLDMEPRDQKSKLAFWAVDEGVLIVIYSTETKKVIGVIYWLSDERDKATRQTFEMKVKSFDTDSGVMVVQTKLPKKG